MKSSILSASTGWRGSSVALLVGYLIGISHVDPLRWGLTLGWNESGAGSLTPRKPPSLAAMLVLFASAIPLLKTPMVVKGQRFCSRPVDPSGYLSWRGYLRSRRAKIS